MLGDFLDRNGELDFSTFLTIMHMQIKQEDPKKEILLAMLMADKEKKGYIMASELRSKLMKLGEKLTHKEGNNLGPSFAKIRELGRTSKPDPCHSDCADAALHACPRRLQVDVKTREFWTEPTEELGSLGEESAWVKGWPGDTQLGSTRASP